MPQLIIITCIIINTIIFLWINHPITIGLILLIQTILNCLLTGFIAKTFWFSYILFLIFIGGMLILFIYIASLASNEKIKFNKLINMKLGVLRIILFLILIFYDKYYLINFINNIESINFSNITTIINENYLSLSKIYDTPNNYIIILIINYLLLTLIVIVKITNLFQGPLRPKFY